MTDEDLKSRHQIRRIADLLVDSIIDSEEVEPADIPDVLDSMDYLTDEQKDQVMQEVTRQIDELTAELDAVDKVTDTEASAQEESIGDVEDQLDLVDSMADAEAEKNPLSIDKVDKLADENTEPVTVSKESVTVGDDKPHDEEYADMGNLFSTISSLR